MRKLYTTYTACLLLILFTACSPQENSLFKQIPSSHTHIDFVNHIQEDTSFNILSYEYLYNGGGVAAGDLNNDGLTDLVFSGNMVKSRIYLNKGNLEFEDITDKSGFNDRERWKTGVVMADVNGDGLLDIYLCYSGPGTDEARSNQLFINNGVQGGIPRFTEQSKQYGLDAPGTYSTTASFFDMDNDGDLDMFLVNHADMFYNPFYNTEKLRTKRHPKFGNRLYRNDNGHFTDISDSANIAGSGLNFGLSVSISDINHDGWADIYVTNDYDERDFLYLNNHNGSFREVLSTAAGHLSEFAMGSDIADYNNDEQADVVVLDMLPEDNHRQKLLKGADTYDKYTTRVQHGFHHQQMRNTLQLNNGVDSAGIPIFSEVGQLAGISKTDWSWAPLLCDFNNDGWKDLFISNGIFKDITNLDFVKYTSGYSNNFSTEKGGDKMEMWKLIQQMPSTKLNNYFFQNNHDLTFKDVSSRWGSGKNTISNGSAYVDLDNDGDLDLVINCLNDAPMILKNQTEEKDHPHYVKIKLKGEGKNSLGIGAKVFITTNSLKQYYEQFNCRGFQSSVDPVLNIGLGNDSIINSIRVEWPNGKVSTLDNISSNRLLTISNAEAIANITVPPISSNNIFTDVTVQSGIAFTHHQSSFVDFKISPLLPYQTSRIGPSLTKGDVNGDGLEDIFIGASLKQEALLYIQSPDGHFTIAAHQPWNNMKDYTISDALFMDADNDGDNDLYIVSGGTDYPAGAKNYQDKIYTNDGKGNFSAEEPALPEEAFSGSCVRSADVNKDGLTDLFVGNKFIPGRFPQAAPSTILINHTRNGKILFSTDPLQTESSLFHPGLVTDAAWIDINKDGWPDLITVGMFMPVTIFENQRGHLVNKTKEYGLAETNGWWCRILADDFDNDGDTDLVLGNIGTNNQFKASVAEPLTITYADFNNDGVIDPILCFYNKGKSYPYFTRDEIFEQIPALQKKFGRYAAYADAQIEDMFSDEQLAKASTIKINTLSSVYLRNDHGKFKLMPLPVEAQMSMAGGLVSADIDKDGHKDIIMAGNCYPMRVQQGPLDASIGTLLKGDGKGHFKAVPYTATGLYVPGDVRSLISIQTKNKELLVAGKCNGPVEVIAIQH